MDVGHLNNGKIRQIDPSEYRMLSFQFSLLVGLKDNTEKNTI